MRYIAALCLSTVLTTALPQQADARAVTYPDGWMLMGMHDYARESGMLIYSPTAQYALGLRTDYMKEDNVWYHTGAYNRLLKRWNGEDSQANLFLQTGLGAAQKGDSENVAGMLGIEADWETRRLYTSYENNYMYAGGLDSNYWQRGRVGVAPYVGGYNDVHTWLMLQVDHRPGIRENLVVTPFVRLFNQEVLGEVGLSSNGDVMVNVTLQF